jgi:hypothetical protein
MTELNIDETPANTALLTSLVGQAQDIIIHSVDSTKTVEDYADNLIFQRAVITLVTQLYYDRTMSGGLSLGLRMMINHLKGEVTVNG